MPFSARAARPFVLWYALSGVFIVLALTPIFEILPVPVIQTHAVRELFKIGLLALAPLGVWLTVRTAADTLGQRLIAAWLSVMAASLCEVIHYWAIDQGHYFPQSMWRDNTAWQLWMHYGILTLNPGLLPHSYRFLPDSIVEIFQWLTGDFWWARLLYRLLAESLLFAVIYRYARLYLTSLGSCAVVLIVVMLYPVSILRYAGQFTDPLSHLSFAICLYALAASYEPAFAPALLVGIFAKESVAVMALCRAFTGNDRARSLLITSAYVIAGVGLVAGIRLFVNSGSFSYNKVSGVEWTHVWTNLSLYRQWAPMYLVTLGFLLPGAAAGWRHFDRGFKATTIVVTISVIVSSMIFSWLQEVRNLVPAFIPLAVATVKAIEVRALTRVVRN